jgi:WD repeat-containing protein 1 (actin-interacting protein 1)
VASGDECGIVRIWSVKDLSRTIIETKMLGGSVNDLCWSEDEKYLSAAGDGRDKFAHVIKIDADGGSNFGELVGPGKCCASVALKGKFCLVGSDDKSVTVFKASPTFKFFKTLRDHDNFVQVIRFNFEGNLFASAGSDGKVFVYSTEGEELNSKTRHFIIGDV